MNYVDRVEMFSSYYPYQPVLSGIKAVDTSAETVQKDLESGNTNNVGSYINTIQAALKDTKSTASDITGIISSISSVVSSLKTARANQAEAARRAEIDAYIANLEAQVDEAKRKLNELRRKTWIKIGLVSAGCFALGIAAYIALKK